MGSQKTAFFGIRVGHQGRAVASSWEVCQAMVSGCSGSEFKKFATVEEALEFAGLAGVNPRKEDVLRELDKNQVWRAMPDLHRASPFAAFALKAKAAPDQHARGHPPKIPDFVAPTQAVAGARDAPDAGDRPPPGPSRPSQEDNDVEMLTVRTVDEVEAEKWANADVIQLDDDDGGAAAAAAAAGPAATEAAEREEADALRASLMGMGAKELWQRADTARAGVQKPAEKGDLIEAILKAEAKRKADKVALGVKLEEATQARQSKRLKAHPNQPQPHQHQQQDQHQRGRPNIEELFQYDPEHDAEHKEMLVRAGLLGKQAEASSDAQASAPKPAAAALSDEQQRALEAALGGRSLFITGGAGVGKSFVVHTIVEALRQQNKTVQVCATTGIAAVNVGGQTIHSFAGILLGEGTKEGLAADAVKKRHIRDRWRAVDTLVIDEISMMHGNLLDKIEYVGATCRCTFGPEDAPPANRSPFGGIQIIFVGDFLQLPPVAGRGENRRMKFAFESPVWAALRLQNVLLTKVFRQSDVEFVTLLNNLRFGIVDAQTVQVLRARQQPLPQSKIRPTILYPTRRDVANKNLEEFNKLPGETITYQAVDAAQPMRQGKNFLKVLDQLQCPKMLATKKGMQVVLLHNLNTAQGLCNGTRGVIIGYTQPNAHLIDQLLHAETRNEEARKAYMKMRMQKVPLFHFMSPTGQRRTVPIGPHAWEQRVNNGTCKITRTQIPLAPAWALTVHKCQGMTLDKVVTDLGQVFEEGMAYVALSRARSLNSLQVNGLDAALRGNKIKASRKVLQYYKSMGQDGPPPTTVIKPVQNVPPAQVAPVQAAPVQAAPVRAAPVQAAPVQAAPVQAAPVQVAPVQVAPMQVAPVQAAPVQAAPMQVAPVQAAPVQAPSGSGKAEQPRIDIAKQLFGAGNGAVGPANASPDKTAPPSPAAAQLPGASPASAPLHQALHQAVEVDPPQMELAEEDLIILAQRVTNVGMSVQKEIDGVLAQAEDPDAALVMLERLRAGLSNHLGDLFQRCIDRMQGLPSP